MEGMHVHRFRYGFTGMGTPGHGRGILPKRNVARCSSGCVSFFSDRGSFSPRFASCGDIASRSFHAHWILPQGLIALLSRKLAEAKRTYCAQFMVQMSMGSEDVFSTTSGNESSGDAIVSRSSVSRFLWI